MTLLFVMGGWWLETSELQGGGDKLARRAGAREAWPSSRESEQKLCHIVSELAIAASLKQPQPMVLAREDSINAFAAGWDEDDAVVAHEFSHLREGERPATVEDRAVPGHSEGDLLFGDRNSQIATLVERHTRYVMLVKVASKDTETVINALIKNARKLPQELYQSLTWDRGKEMADHKCFTLATDINVYFCDPQSPWQRGSNENTNGLLRQYFPKGVDISDYSQAQLNAVARKLNERPRKTLNYETPAERFSQLVASTG